MNIDRGSYPSFLIFFHCGDVCDFSQCTLDCLCFGLAFAGFPFPSPLFAGAAFALGAVEDVDDELGADGCDGGGGGFGPIDFRSPLGNGGIGVSMRFRITYHIWISPQGSDGFCHCFLSQAWGQCLHHVGFSASSFAFSKFDREGNSIDENAW